MHAIANDRAVEEQLLGFRRGHAMRGPVLLQVARIPLEAGEVPDRGRSGIRKVYGGQMQPAGAQRPGSNAPDLSSCRPEDPLNLGAQLWNLLLQHIPDEIQVDAEGVVNEPIAHASHRAPFDIAVLWAHILWNALRCLADDLEAANGRTLQRLVILELLAGHARTGPDQVVSFGEDVPEELTRLERHPALRRGYMASGTATAPQS